MSLPYLTYPSTVSTKYVHLVSQVIIGRNTISSVLPYHLHTKCSLTLILVSVKVHIRLCRY